MIPRDIGNLNFLFFDDAVEHVEHALVCGCQAVDEVGLVLAPVGVDRSRHVPLIDQVAGNDQLAHAARIAHLFEEILQPAQVVLCFGIRGIGPEMDVADDHNEVPVASGNVEGIDGVILLLAARGQQ